MDISYCLSEVLLAGISGLSHIAASLEGLTIGHHKIVWRQKDTNFSKANITIHTSQNRPKTCQSERVQKKVFRNSCKELKA